MNRLTATICVLILVCLAPASTAPNAMGRDNSGNDILVMYSRVALIEFCQKSDIDQCDEVGKWFSDSSYQLLRYGSGLATQYMVVFTGSEKEYLPFAILGFDKDGWLRVVTRGVHLGEKSQFIETFEKEGDFAR